MTPEEADNAQQWEGMDGAIAWQLIDRHADDWGDIREMMNAWLRANVAAAVKVEREACAKVCDGYAEGSRQNMADVCAEKIRMRSNDNVTGLAPAQEKQK